MFRLPAIVLSVFCFAVVNADEPRIPQVDLDSVDRSIQREPEYHSTPKYCLLLLGASGSVKVWMVEDGERLFVDRNANGDLTDDGPPIEPSDVREWMNGHRDFNYLSDAITAEDGSRCTKFDLRRWNYGTDEDKYGLSLTLEGDLAAENTVGDAASEGELKLAFTGQRPMYAGWFGTFWSPEPETAPVIHFGGALKPVMLREKEFVIGSGRRRLSLALINPGSGPGAVSRLSIESLPEDVIPKLTIDWPTDVGTPALQTSHQLISRCCYWEFYTTTFEVPSGVRAGSARVTVEFPGYQFPFNLATNTVDVPVVEKVSPSAD